MKSEITPHSSHGDHTVEMSVWERGIHPLINLFLAKICEGWEERERNTGASPVSSLAELVSLL